MNKTDRERFQRIYSALEIPGCHSGPSSQSISIKGVSSFATDITYALPRARHLMTLVIQGESYDGQFDEEMEELETWREKRISENWQHPNDLTH